MADSTQRSTARSIEPPEQRVDPAPFTVRAARDEDRRGMASVFAAVAEERDGIASEPPVDAAALAKGWTLDGTFVDVTGNDVVGFSTIEDSSRGYGEINMLVAAEWRGRGVGGSLLKTAIEWARASGMHKLILSVWPHHAAAIALYRKCGFVEEGYRPRQIRRQSGELWDIVEMGLLL